MRNKKILIYKFNKYSILFLLKFQTVNNNRLKKQAIIFAGGKGMRLRPFTHVIPKPLLPVGKFSSLEIILKQLKKYKFNEVFLCVNYRADLIKSFFGNGEKIGIKINYIIEKNPRGTIGGLNLIKNLTNRFLVINGDIISNINLNNLLKNHNKHKSILTTVIKKINIRSKYGVIYKEKKKLIFKEKPLFSSNILTGIYVMEKDILKLIPKNIPFGIDMLLKKLIIKNIDINMYLFDGFWSDIGTEEDYFKINKLFNSKKSGFVF